MCCNVTYFDSFGCECIPKEILKSIRKKNITTNTYTTQGYDSVKCEYFCIRYIDFLLNKKSLTEFTNSSSPSNFKKNNKIILERLQ